MKNDTNPEKICIGEEVFVKMIIKSIIITEDEEYYSCVPKSANKFSPHISVTEKDISR